jgi:nicotinamidase-related amidase
MNKQHAEQEVARRETRSTLLDPITPENAVLLLVDQQEGLFTRIYEPEQTRRQLLGLARSTRLLSVPAVLTTALATGPNGPMLHELTTIFDGAEVIDRTIINAWRDPRVHEAIMRTGRKKVIIAGTGFDICAQLPALSSVAEGYDTYVVVDACGRFDPSPSVATITRLAQAGVALVNTRTIVLEMMADNAHPKAKEIYSALPPGLVTPAAGGSKSLLRDHAPGA